MKLKPRISWVALTGGLGNQLFQFSCALNRSENIYLDSSLLKPRLNHYGNPELTSFQLPNYVIENDFTSRNSKFSGRITGLLLRNGLLETGFQSNRVAQYGIKLIAFIFLSILRMHFIYPVINQGVGFSVLKSKRKNELLIGYFQSYLWAIKPEVKSKLMQIVPREESEELLMLKNMAIIEKPLIVHIRLGDYKAEKHFGLPDSKYYSQAINLLWKTNKYNKIWVFSDEPELAVHRLDKEYSPDIRWINEVGASPTQTLQAMRFGSGYVIANSTFSWWGAFLSFTPYAPVVAPDPWFAGMEDPTDLIPPNWIRVNSITTP